MSRPQLPELGAFRTLEALARFQDEHLPDAIAEARRSPFYAARLGEGETLVSQPFTKKDDLRDAYPFGMLAVSRRELATYHESSGTTGEPVSSYFTEADWDDIASRFARNAVGLSAADTVLVKTPYAMVTTAHQMHRAARLRGALVVPADNRSAVMSYRRVLRLLTDVGVTVAWCMPTEALLWAETARLLGMSTKQTTLRALVVAGEPLARARKARLEALLGARVFEDYGSTETGSLAGECTAGALHLWADRFVPEVVDPETGASSREGVGRLAITTLFRQAMPLVRFLLDDTVEVSHRPCSCGWALPIVRVLGRPASLMRVANVPVSMVALDEVVFSLPASLGVSFWRARPSGDALAIEIETAPEAAQVASAALASGLHERLGITAHVRAVGAGTIVPHERLLADAPFMKPRFLFAERESWDGGVAY